MNSLFRRHFLQQLVPVVAIAAAQSQLGAASEARTGGSLLPWPPQYKIKPVETRRLTPADVVGPDGLVYPNWTRCGVQGGIPEVKRFDTIEAYGGRADDDVDDAPALERACEAAGRNGGGAVALRAGTYFLDRPVTVRHDGVVIQGQGAAKTRIVFRYALPSTGIGFFWPPAGSRVGRNTRLELHARPSGLVRMRMVMGDHELAVWNRGQHSGNTFFFASSGRQAIGRLPDGAHRLQGIAEYANGTTLTTELPVVLDSSFDDDRLVPDARGAITFAGRGLQGLELKLARDGRRGDLVLHLSSVQGLRTGDCVMIDGPATERWKQLTQNACLWGTYRRYETVIEKVEGSTVTLSQPLRLEFPVVDGSYVQKVVAIQRCGVADFYLEQTENLWISSVLFSHAWNCWARGVTVKKCGRFPVYGSQAKWCEIRDCLFDDAWFKGGGGTAYTGWDGCWDCLMENVETRKMRHAPLFQWAASGNVIRKSVFHESDGQWHAGWCNENLFEQCRIESVAEHGAYGYGLWASPPQDTAHGPNGPRNVVYNCDVSSPKAGLWMGGMNENWLILHNRFVVERGQGVYAGTTSFDHIIQGNVFVLKDGQSPMLFLSRSNCVGVEVRANRLYGGNGQIAAGQTRPLVMDGNQVLPLGDGPRPTPPVRSIYEWQLNHAKVSQVKRAGSGFAAGPLRVHPSNPRYFTDGVTNAYGLLRAVYLTGAHTWDNLQDMGEPDPPAAFDFDAYLDFLAEHEHNFIRLWRWELVSWDTSANDKKTAKHLVAAPHPWPRTGPGQALDGKPKFKLDELNDAYFQRLRSCVAAARERGIYVSVMLFEGWGVQHVDGAWKAHPFHPDNNVNGVNGDADGDGQGMEIHGLRVPAVTRIQEAYVRKVIDTVNDLDNVLYEIANESGAYSTEWQEHFIRFIHEYERGKPKQHPVGMTFQYSRDTKQRGSNANLFHSSADWISPNPDVGQFNYRTNPPPADGRKVILSDTDHLWGIGGDVAWVWKSFLRGLNPLFMDPYKQEVLRGGADSKWEPVRRAMGVTRRLADRVGFAAMTPRGELASSGYCLANPAKEYLVYLPSGGEVSVDLGGVAGEFQVEWIHPIEGKTIAAPAVSGGASTIVKAPQTNGTVLHLWRN